VKHAAVPAGFTAVPEPLTPGRVLEATTPGGTPVIVRPMPGFSKSYAVLATRFGSLDSRLPDGTPLPDGLAHFFEHKMFEKAEGDVFDLYAARGASANAYTTFSHTAYLFSCSRDFDANLDTLLETLVSMDARPEGIEREKGIIGQEIAMYEDDASWRAFEDLLAALYRVHPVRIPVAGTKESIAPIDREVLERTHAAYYHPANLCLVAAGDVDPARVLARATAALDPKRPGARNRRPRYDEPREPAREESVRAMPVVRHQVLLGIKDEPGGESPRERVRRETESSILLDALFGDGGLVEAPLHRAGLADETLSASYESEPDFSFAVVSAEVDDPAAYRERLLAALEAARRAGGGEEDVERARRRAIGGHLRAFNSPERVAGMLLGLHLADTTLADAVDALKAVDAAAVNRRLDALLRAPRAWSTIRPA
jgi:predicted Zn-dependent peptidase